MIEQNKFEEIEKLAEKYLESFNGKVFISRKPIEINWSSSHDGLGLDRREWKERVYNVDIKIDGNPKSFSDSLINDVKIIAWDIVCHAFNHDPIMTNEIWKELRQKGIDI